MIIEAEPRNARRLQAAAAALPDRNVDIVSVAAWSCEGAVTMDLSPAPGDHKIAASGSRIDNDTSSWNRSYEHREVQANTLDNIFAAHNVGHVNFLAVTVNGAELQVIAGAEGALASSVDRVYAKGHAIDSDGDPLNRAISTLLRQLGFRTCTSRGEPAAGTDPGWSRRDGDVFAYKPRADKGPRRRPGAISRHNASDM